MKVWNSQTTRDLVLEPFQKNWKNPNGSKKGFGLRLSLDQKKWHTPDHGNYCQLKRNPLVDVSISFCPVDKYAPPSRWKWLMKESEEFENNPELPDFSIMEGTGENFTNSYL